MPTRVRILLSPLPYPKMVKKISKTKIEKRMQKKTNPGLVRAIIQLKKTNPLIAKKLASPVKKTIRINLEKINEKVKDKTSILVVGKVLSSGNLDKKVKIVGLSASEKAIEKIKKSGGEFVYLFDELKNNPKLNGLEIVE